MSDQPLPDPWAELRGEMARALAVMAEYDDRERVDDETAEQLQADAILGRLGEGMKELAEQVDDGELTWEQIFRDPARYGAQLAEHVERMAREHAADIATALQQDPEVDDLGPPSGPADRSGGR